MRRLLAMTMLLAGAALWWPAGTPALAQARPVTIKVDVKSDSSTQNKDGKGTDVTKTETRQLEIKLTNSLGKPLENLTVRYFIFGRDLEGKDIEITTKGEKTISLAAAGGALIKSEGAKFAQHRVSSKTNTKTTGTKCAGYGVQALVGNQLLGETFEPPELKAQIKLEPATPAKAPKKK